MKTNQNTKPKEQNNTITKARKQAENTTFFDRQMQTLVLVDQCKTKLQCMIDKAEYPSKINDISSAIYRCNLVETAIYECGNITRGKMLQNDAYDNANALADVIAKVLLKGDK